MGEGDGTRNVPLGVMLGGAGVDDHYARLPGQQIRSQIRRIGTKLQLGFEEGTGFHGARHPGTQYMTHPEHSL